MKVIDAIMHKNVRKVILLLTAVLVAVTAIIYKLDFICVLPLFVSLFVVMYQSEARRSAYLIGGLNALLYAGIYFFYFKLYGNGLTSVLVSFPLQVATFINWKKHSYKKSTYFKRMSAKVRILVASGVAVTFAVLFAILTAVGSQYAILDNISSILGTLISFLILFAYIEYCYLQPILTFLAIMLQIQVLINDPASVPYLVMAIYNFYCGINTFITVRRIYKTQQAEIGAAEIENT